ncbi:MAG: hypothetical protein M3R02_28010 [Chloroflexota bacterium]|nr:hypothetical protein [Chloroflexota bacterium]
MSSQGADRTFYRVIPQVEPTANDFLSDKELGEPPPASNDPIELRMWEGVSFNNSETQARIKATDLPFLGAYVAVVEIEGANPVITYKRTGKSRGHYTLWGNAGEMVRCVVRVIRAADGVVVWQKASEGRQ